MKHTILGAVAVSSLFLMSGVPAHDGEWTHGAVTRVDGSAIETRVLRGDGGGRMPIVLAIDGSLCIPSTLGNLTKTLEPTGAERFALLVIEKPGPTIPEPNADGDFEIGPELACTETFKKYYSIDQRIDDHLRVIQHLRRRADWWDGRLLIWGVSDGARIGTRVAAYTPETVRVILGGFGGGTPMARDFEDFHICAPGRTDDRDACVERVRERFDAMRQNPTPDQSWSGDSNTHRAWASRLDAVDANVLFDLPVPVLVYHGENDNSVPVASARALAQTLGEPGGPTFHFHEIPGMGHGLGSGLDPGTARGLHERYRAWLLDGDPATLTEARALFSR